MLIMPMIMMMRRLSGFGGLEGRRPFDDDDDQKNDVGCLFWLF